MNPAGRDESKTAEARARRASRKPADDAEVLDPDDPEFDAKLDASIERAYERIEDELNRAIEDLRAVPFMPSVSTRVSRIVSRKLSTTLSRMLSPKYLRLRVTRACARTMAGPPNRHCERAL